MGKAAIKIMAFCALTIWGKAQETYHFVHNGLNREYIMYLPTDLPVNAPLVVVAHGYGDSHTAIMNYSGMNAVADQHGFAVCYPKGTTDNVWGGQNFWNVGYDLHEGNAVDDLDFIRSLTEHLQSTYGLNADKTFMTGMSNGADLCYLMACESPGIFRAFAPVAGSIFPNGFSTNSCEGLPVPIFEIHGENDDVTLFEGDLNDDFFGPYLAADSVIQLWVEINNLEELSVDTLPNMNNNNEWTISYKYTSPNSVHEVWLYKHKNGHSWSVDDLNVSQEIWAFFEQMSINTTAGISGASAEEPMLQLFPNPSSHQVTIFTTSDRKNQQFHLFDQEGRIVHSACIKSTHTVLHLEALKKGVYYLILENERTVRRKIVRF